MSQVPELFGKWWVYRYCHPELAPVLKASETTLEISQQSTCSCLARFEMSGSTEPVEIEMNAKEDSWWSNEEGSFGFLDVRWSRFEHGNGEPAVLVGQVINKEDHLRDFFVAVRSRRTHRQCQSQEALHHFEGAYSIPSVRDGGPTIKREDDTENPGADIDLRDPENRVIRFGRRTFKLEDSTLYRGGLVIVGQEEGGANLISLWLLPVVDPRQPRRPLAIGFIEYYQTTSHQEAKASGTDPKCQRHLCLS